MKHLFVKGVLTGAVSFILAGQSAKATVVYDNTNAPSGYNLSFVNDWNIGNEVIMGNGFTSGIITNFSFDLYSSQSTFSGNVKMQVYLFSNDGTPQFNGYYTPGTQLWTSGLFDLSAPPYGGGGGFVGTLNFNQADLGGGVTINTPNFTFAAVVKNMTGGDNLAFRLYTPASGVSVGSSYGDYWVNQGSSWALQTNAFPTTIGARFEASPVPEPTTLSLAGLGVLLFAGARKLRQSRRS
jgi:hypothetical protein